MKGKGTLKKLTLQEAYDNLEEAVENLLDRAQWYSPYNGFPYKRRRMTTPINELRKPLLELRLAKRNKNATT